jgi:putative effector of murein hydrolase LrgA (UPF0299 family)
MNNHFPIDTSFFGQLKALMYPLVVGIVAVLQYINIDANLILIYATLLGIDSVSGWIKAWRIDPKSVKSSIAISGLMSKMIMLLVPVVIGLCVKALGQNSSWLVNVVFSVLTLAEAYSFLGNVYAIRTRKEVEEWDAVSAVLLGLKRILRKQIEKQLEEDEKG